MTRQRILELHRKGFTEEEAAMAVAFWKTMGIKVKWGTPWGDERFTKVRGVLLSKEARACPKAICPGCNHSLHQHYSIWRQTVDKDGFPNGFVKVCRSCEDQANGGRCVTCQKWKGYSEFRTNLQGIRKRVCRKCCAISGRARVIKCPKCNESKSERHFYWINADRTQHSAYCRSCEAERHRQRRLKNRTSRRCRGCQKTRPISDFELDDKGVPNRTCNPCYDLRASDLPRACDSCHRVQAADEFTLSGHRPGHRRTTCRGCRNRVAKIKRIRKERSVRQ